MGRTSGKLTESLVERIRGFQRKDQANRKCADCTELGPTYVCLDYKTFVCQTCSGIHREFGHRIKSISMSEWSVAEAESLESGGNRRAAAKWLAQWTPEKQAEPDSANDAADKFKKLDNAKRLEAVHTEVRNFLKEKYVRKTWERQGESPRNDPEPACFPATSTPSTSSGVSDSGQSCTSSDMGISFPAPPRGALCDLLGEDQKVMDTSSVIVDTNESMLDLDCSGLVTTAPLEKVLPPPPNPGNGVDLNTGWTANFSPNATKPSEDKCDMGLLDLNLSGFEFPVTTKPAPTITTAAGLDDSLLGDCIVSPKAASPKSAINPSGDAEEPAAEPAAEPAVAEPEDPGAQLRKALLSGSSADVLRFVGEATKPAGPTLRVDQARFAALQGSAFDDLFTAAHVPDQSASLLDAVQSPQSPQIATPAVASSQQPTATPQPAPPPASDSSEMFSDLLGDIQNSAAQPSDSQSSSPGNCQYFNIQDEEDPSAAAARVAQAAAAAALLGSAPAPAPAPTTAAAPASAPAPMAAAQVSMPQHLQQLGSQDLVQMHNMIEQVLHMRKQQVACAGAPAAAPASAMQDLETPSPPKQFNDLLAAFHQKNPIAGL